MKLEFEVRQQEAKVLGGNNELVAESRNYVFAHFTFTNDWRELTKTIFFKQGESTFITLVLDQNDCCLVPKELLANDGDFTIHVTGSGIDGTIITTNPIKVFVKGNGIITNDNTGAPTVDFLTESVTTVKKYRDEAEGFADETKETKAEAVALVANIKESETNAAKYADAAGKSAVASENSAKEAANSAKEIGDAESRAKEYAEEAGRQAVSAGNSADGAERSKSDAGLSATESANSAAAAAGSERTASAAAGSALSNALSASASATAASNSAQGIAQAEQSAAASERAATQQATDAALSAAAAAGSAGIALEASNNVNVFVPAVSPGGDISWTNPKGLPNPATVNIKGPKGDTGEPGIQGVQKVFENIFAMQRTGKVYQVKLPKFASNPTSAGEKLLGNAGLVFEPSTDTVEGRDDYANIPLFKWWHCNYIREDNTDVRITAVKGADGYKEEGAVDVGAMGMTFYWGVVDNSDHILLTISDSPHPELNLKPWVESVRADGTVAPYWCHSAFMSVLADDGLYRSQPYKKPVRNQSHNNMITNYAKKGKGYTGAGDSRNTFQVIFNAIMGATKNSQTLYAGVTDHSFQYPTLTKSASANNYVTVSASQAANIPVGTYVSIGYKQMVSGSPSTDRYYDNLHKYADDVVVLSKETQSDGNVRVYVDAAPFPTLDVTIASGVTSEVYISSMHAHSGETNKVIGKHNGSPVSNTNGKYPYRVQGTEYAVGGYVVASDIVMFFKEDYSKDVYVAPKGVAHSSSDATILATYTNVGNIPASADGKGNDYYSGDIGFEVTTGVTYPSTQGVSSSQGTGDYVYTGGAATSGSREYLIGGVLGYGGRAGALCVYCWLGLGGEDWYCLSAD